MQIKSKLYNEVEDDICYKKRRWVKGLGLGCCLEAVRQEEDICKVKWSGYVGSIEAVESEQTVERCVS